MRQCPDLSRLEAMEEGRRKRLPIIGLYMLVLVIATGCAPRMVDIVRSFAPTVRAHPQLQQRLASIKTVAVMPPGVAIYQVAVGGATKVTDEEATAAKRTVATAIEQELGRDAGVVFTPFPSSSVGLDVSSDPTAAGLKDELADTQALFGAVSASIVLHTYYHDEGAFSDWRFVEKLTNFDYSLGPDVQRLSKLANADALLFTSGVDHNLSGGLKALTTAGVLAIMLLSQGQASFRPIGAELTRLSVALVDAATGALLWYNVAGFQGGVYSLTDPHSVTDLTAQVLKDFPLGMRPTRKAKEDEWSCLPSCRR